MNKQLRFSRIRNLMGVRKAPGPNGTTIWGIWAVATMRDLIAGRREIYLGEIRWFSRWRGYMFAPATETIFSPDCARKIADFCEAQTNKQKRRKK